MEGDKEGIFSEAQQNPDHLNKEYNVYNPQTLTSEYRNISRK